MNLSGVQASHCHPAARRLGVPGGMPRTSAASVLLVNWLQGTFSLKAHIFHGPTLPLGSLSSRFAPSSPLLSCESGGCYCYVRGRREVAQEPSHHPADKPPGPSGSSLPFPDPSSGWNFLPGVVPLAQVGCSFLQFRVQDTQRGMENNHDGNPLNPNCCPASTPTTAKTIRTTTHLFPTLCLMWLTPR